MGHTEQQAFPLRLSASLKAEAMSMAHRDGISLNQFISHAVSQQILRMNLQAAQRHEANQERRPPRTG
jgi:hypothetical protein